MRGAEHLRLAAAVLLAATYCARPLSSQSTELQSDAPEVEFRSSRPPPSLEVGVRPPPLERLPLALVASPEQLDEIAQWNASGNLPLRTGFNRGLKRPHSISFPARVWKGIAPGLSVSHAGGLLGRDANGDVVWEAEVEVDGADRLRLHLSEVDLPAETLFWVYGSTETVGPFGLELWSPEQELWTPSVSGESIRIVLSIPYSQIEPPTRFVIDQVMEIFRLDEKGAPISGLSVDTMSSHCLIDAECVTSATFDAIEAAQRAVGRMEFVKGGSTFLCTGGLLEDQDNTSVIPYFLTANHCLSTQAVASTLEVFWDYHAYGCLGPWPTLASRPKSIGATMLETGAATDFTFLRLFSIPSNRALLGWTTATLASLTTLHRISHPLGYPHAYSRTAVTLFSSTCVGLPRPSFLYQFQDIGGVSGGSSGAPVLLPGGLTVGQLLGICGATGDGCVENQVDGAFSQTFPLISQYINIPSRILNVTRIGTGTGTVSSSPGGISCGGDCQQEFPGGTFVQLQAVPADNSDFNGWGGDSDCADGNVTMNADKDCTARFDLEPLLMISKVGAGGGNVTSTPPGIACGGDCSEYYDLGTLVYLLASPDTGSEFSGWSGHADCVDGAVLMDADRSCTASFDACSIESEVTLTNHSISSEETHEACNRLIIGPSVEVTGSGMAHFRAGNSVEFVEPVSVLAGGEVEVQIGPPTP